MEANVTEANVTEECLPVLSISSFTHYSLIPSACIITLFAILHGRGSVFGSGWRPGMVVPLNFLDGYTNRWGYAAAFGAIANRVLILITNRDIYWGGEIIVPQWVQKTFMFLLATAETSFVFYPLFACLTTPFKLLGSILGAAYTLLWCTVQIIYMVDCHTVDESFFSLGIDYSKLILEWPSAVFYLLLSGAFLYMLWTCLQTREFVVQKKPELALPHQVLYVKKLLKDELPKNVVSSFNEGFLDTFKYKSLPGFVYPSRLLCVLFVSISFSYQLLISIAMEANDFTQEAERTITSLVALIDDDYTEPFVKAWFIALSVCYWLTLVLVAVLIVISSFLIFKNYRRHTLQLCRGDKTFVPYLNASSVGLMASSMRWSAYQIVYLLWGATIFGLSIFVVMMAMVTAIIVYLYLYSWEGVLSVLLWFGPPLVMSLVLFFGQLLLTRLFFIQPPAEPKQPLPLAVDNRKGFETVYYFLFFINIAIGFVSSIIRLFLSVVVGLLTLPRMDEPIFRRGYERFDKGHSAYMAMLFVDYTHNHPVLRVFCNELAAATDRSRATTPRELEAGQSLFVRRKGSASVRARWKWDLAYTLIRNPDILLSRKYNLAKLPQFTEIYVISPEPIKEIVSSRL